MLRYALAFTLLALAGALLILPDPTLARPSFRPAFTGGPFRIVIPGGRARLGGPQRATARPIGQPLVSPRPVSPVQAALHTEGPRPTRSLRYRHFGRWGYPLTFGADWSYYGTPYDPSDATPVDAATPDREAPQAADEPAPQAPTKEARGCRAERIVVPAASGTGESEITIVRC